jgi:hypothetical protein
MRNSFRIALSAALVLAVFSGRAAAQTADQYLQNNPYYGVDRGSTPDAGGDDSTVGSSSVYTPASLSISPGSRQWTSASQWQSFTVTNNGEMTTSAIAATTGGSFSVSNGCSTLAKGQSCTIQVRPNGSSGASDVLRVSASWGGSAQANLTLVPPASLSMSPASASWDHDNSWKSFTVRNNGGQASSAITASLSAGGSYFDVSSACTTLAGGASCQVQVRPKAGVAQDVTGSLRVSATDGGTQQASLTAAMQPVVTDPCAGAPAYYQNAYFKVEPACLYWEDENTIKHIVITNVSGATMRAGSGDGAAIDNPWRSGFILSGSAGMGTACPAVFANGAICRLGIQNLLITRPIGISSFNFPLYPEAHETIGATYGGAGIRMNAYAKCIDRCAYWVTQ